MNAATADIRPITVAILALGGEGGGVLADWLVDVAQHAGYLAQATSVPGVAQRTGATIYYVELFPKSAAQAAGRGPVLALMPMPGDVDVVLASELMEAARAIERGFVTPDKTLLIASTHRVFAMSEKIALADGRADSAALFGACGEAARQFIAFDMAALADATGSVLSAVLFGALAGANALPFPRSAFESAIRRAGVGVERSLTAFAAGFEAARSGEASEPAAQRGFPPQASPPIASLRKELAQEYSGEARAVVTAAIERLVDYQDEAYARTFLARLARLREIEERRGDHSGALISEVARQLALAMAYEDVIRVAELKIRPSRFAKVRDEAQVEPGQILEIAEYFHPRVEEIADTLPAAFGRWLLRTGWARRIVERFTRKGKTVKTTSVTGFLLLYSLAKLKVSRRRSLRFSQEQSGIEAWLELVAQAAAADYAFAAEVARARSLVKGYGDTLERGRAKFAKISALLPQIARSENAATLLGGLIKAALQDEHGRALDKAIAELETKRAPLERNAMPYDLNQFIADCRSILKRDPSPRGREEVRSRLERLLADKQFVEQYCEKLPRGLKVLHDDPELGFQILAHINDKARASPPHDHGASWAIYGQATHYTDMTEWQREDDGSKPGEAKLKPVKKYRLTPGHAGIYQDGTIHSIDYPDGARFIRVTGTNLDNIERVRFDLETGKMHRMTPQQAT